MKAQRYLVAKFVPDVRRMEPRNVGVILWTRHRIGCRFLPSAQSTGIGASQPLYERWVRYWLHTCATGEINLGRGKIVTRKKPEFIDALLAEGQRGGFRLVESGSVKESIKVADIDTVVGRIFDDLVATGTKEDAQRSASASLSRKCNALFDHAGLTSDPQFIRGTSKVPCKIGMALRRFPINYRLGSEDEPTALFHRVNLGSDKSVDSVSYMFEQLVRAGRVSGIDRCAALFERSAQQEAIPGAELQLAEYCIPIDIAQLNVATALVKQVGYGMAS